MSVHPDVFTVEEIAQAAGVPLDAVREVLAAQPARAVPGTTFFGASAAIRIGLEARRSISSSSAPARNPESGIFTTAERTTSAMRSGGLPSFASSLVHGVFILTMLWLTSGSPESATIERPASRLVFLALPGPGGGGGGGGLVNPLPARSAGAQAQFHSPRPAADVSRDRTPLRTRRIETPRPAPAPAENPLPSRRLVAPVQATSSDALRDGALQARSETASAGSGTDGGTGTGRGTGDGEGRGAGIGPGTGGGTGGGPYRAGSGVEPPRLLREVKARYTDDARRRGVTGNVLLEIVITRDGTVGEVSVRRGLGAGLDERAIDAVRQWRFAPARRLGEPVDVIVEVAVEFMLR